MATTTETLIDGLGSGANHKGFYAKAAGLAQKAVKDQNGDTIDQTYVKSADLPTVDQNYNATSSNAQSGYAVAQALSGTGKVPAVLSTDDGKVLKATYSGGVGSFAWEPDSSNMPSPQAADQNKVLGVIDDHGTMDWVSQTPAQIQADWNQTNDQSKDFIKNKPNIPAAAGDATITVKVASTAIGTFTTNQSVSSEINIPEASTTTTGVMSSADKSKLDGIATGAQVNVKPNWNAASGTDAEILNKPDLSVYALSSSLKTVATSGSYNDLTDKPTIPTIPVNDVKVDGSSVVNDGVAEITLPTFTQVNSSWTESDSSSPAYIQNKPTLATVATSGSYTDLSNKPNIPAAQVQSDWEESDTTSKAYINNKPDLSIYAQTTNLATVASSGSYTDLSNKPTIPDAQVQSDWAETDSSSKAYVANKPNLSTVATSGSYNDLSNKPTIYDSTVNVKTGDSTPATLGSFSTNQSSGSDITIPLAASGSGAKSGLMSAADKTKLDDFSAVPAAGSRTGKFMKDDGTWDTPTDTTYSGGDGIDITSGIITVDLASSNSGLVIDSHKLAVNANSAKGIEVGASGVGVRLATNSGLEFSSGLKVKTDGTTIQTNASGELEAIGGGGEVNVVDGVQLEGASAVLPPDSTTKVVTIPNAIPTGTTGASNGLITADDQAKLDKATVYQANPYDSTGKLLVQQFYVVTSDQQIIDIATAEVPNRSGTIFFRIG